MEDDGAEEENFGTIQHSCNEIALQFFFPALRLSRRFPSLDIANGNASDDDYPRRWISVAQQRLEEAIKQKMEKNRRLLANKTNQNNWQDMSPDYENSNEKEAESPGSEDWAQFTSDSESPSDPYSQLTFQEAARR